MEPRKCKNAVFSIVFLFFFFLGTICGIFLFRCIAQSQSLWLRDYCTALSGAFSGPGAVAALLRPLLVVLAVGMFPFGHRLLPLIIFFRGCLMAYCFSACFAAGLSPELPMLRGVLLLPLFYFFCRWVSQMHGARRGTSETMRG